MHKYNIYIIQALAECESALRQYVHREYFLAAVYCRQGSRHRINLQARWMAQSGRVGAVYPNWDAYQWIPMDTVGVRGQNHMSDRSRQSVARCWGVC